ncbi:MAG TPA: RHS repeat-associated core domain-containing protein [Verrucomicrobiae bacterium]|nr:RHS repeat-associated core domain-containing protein [Verrucomicrobiae bacterium]
MKTDYERIVVARCFWCFWMVLLSLHGWWPPPAAGSCDVVVRIDGVMVSSNRSAVGFPPLLIDSGNPAIYFKKTVRQEATINNSCYICHENGHRITSDSYRYDPVTGAGPLHVQWSGSIRYRSETNGLGAFECISTRTGPDQWSDPACGFSIGVPPEVVVSNRTPFAYTLIRVRQEHGLVATPRGTAVKDVAEETQLNIEMDEELALADFVEDAREGLEAAPWPSWGSAWRGGWAERGGRHVLTVWNDDRAEFNAALTKLKYRIALRGPKGQKRLITWVERFTPNGEGPIVDTPFSEELVCTGAEQFAELAGGPEGKVVAPPPVAGRTEVLLVGEWSCGSGFCQPGRGKVSTGSLDINISLGKTLTGQSAGFLALHADTPDPSLTKPDRLQQFIDASVEVLRDGPHLRQLRAPQTLVLIVPSVNAYEIRFHPLTTERDASGFYLVNGQPQFTWRIERPGSDPDTLRVTQTSYHGSLVSEFQWLASEQAWSLVVGDLRKEVRSVSETNGLRLEHFTIRETDDRIAYEQMRAFRHDPFLGDLLLREEIGDSAAPLVTSWNYYTDPAAGPWFGKLQSVIHADGAQESLAYDERGRVRLESSDFALVAGGHVTEYAYAPVDALDDGSREPDSPRVIIERVLGSEVSRRYRSFRLAETLEIECQQPGAAWDAPDNLVTITRLAQDDLTGERIETVLRPDRTLEITRRTSSSDSELRIERIETGAPNPDDTAVVDGTRVETVFDRAGRIVAQSSYDVRSGTALTSDTYTYNDPFGPPSQIDHLDGTATFFVYDCCHLVLVVDPEGTVTRYTYDLLGRRASLSRNGITEFYSYDAADNLVLTRRQGTNGSIMLLRTAAFDLAGREVQFTDGADQTTARSFARHPQGGTLQQTQLPDGGMLSEWTAPDGRAIEISGSASRPVHYSYGVEMMEGSPRRFILETARNFDGTSPGPWTKTYLDALGRPSRMVRADGAIREFFYNAGGQLRKQRDFDGRATLYAYNPRGEVEFTALDVDDSDTIDLAGVDRVSRQVTDFVDGRQRTRRYVWPVAGVDAPQLDSTQERSLDGRFTLLADGGRSGSTEIELLGDGLLRRTVRAEDGSTTVGQFTQGQLRSLTRAAAGGEVLEQAEYAYDAHGRLLSVTDKHTGALVEYQYDSGDRMAGAKISEPGQTALTKKFSYDGLGRPTRVVLPDGLVRTNLYTAAGLPRSQFGARVFPAAQEYDAQGRLTELMTWSRAGTVKTRWEYDPLTGWPSRKIYADGSGPTFAYTPTGYLATNRSGRTISTRHYDAAGDLDFLSRDGVGPELTVRKRDRLGRPWRVEYGTNVTELAYDASGRLSSESFHSVWVSNILDYAGRSEVIQVSQGPNATPLLEQQTHYDGASRVREIVADSVQVTYRYLANSSLIGEILFREQGQLRLVTTCTYDSRGRLTGLAQAPADAPALTFDYQYNAAGQRTNVTEADGSTWAYAYDGLGQVSSGRRRWKNGATVPGQQFEYAYDQSGNRISAQVGGDDRGGGLRSIGFTANTLNQYHTRANPSVLELFGEAPPLASVSINQLNVLRYDRYFYLPLYVNRSTGAVDPLIEARANWLRQSKTNAGRLFVPPITESFSYDADGNRMADGHWRYTWDADNHLIEIEAPPSVPDTARGKLSFTYDFRGRRLGKSVWRWDPAARDYQLVWSRKFVYDGWRLLAEFDEREVLVRSYVWGRDLTGRREGGDVLNTLVAMIDHLAGSICFYAQDAQGNVRALVDGADGQIVGRYEYGPFGELLRVTGPRGRDNPFRFTACYYDHETGLIYFGYRYYSPRDGSWLSRDPIGERGGANLYGFARNDPLDYRDALGLRAEFPHRDLSRYRVCKRSALIAQLQQGGVEPGDYQKDCCQLITVLIKLPLCTAPGLDGKGLGGHTGIGIEDEYYDFGPARSVGPIEAVIGVPGSPWWDDPNFGAWDTQRVHSTDDIMLSDILSNMEEGFGREPFGPDGMPLDVFKIEMAVTAAEAERARDYWRHRYQHPGYYRILGGQCSTTVMSSLEHAGVYDRPFLTFSPAGFLKSLPSTTHTCGPNRGKRVKIEQISSETPLRPTPVSSCANP